jgi:hypothetical protein
MQRFLAPFSKILITHTSFIQDWAPCVPLLFCRNQALLYTTLVQTGSILFFTHIRIK